MMVSREGKKVDEGRSNRSPLVGTFVLTTLTMMGNGIHKRCPQWIQRGDLFGMHRQGIPEHKMLRMELLGQWFHQRIRVRWWRGE
jgi:hypothetical protein